MNLIVVNLISYCLFLKCRLKIKHLDQKSNRSEKKRISCLLIRDTHWLNLTDISPFGRPIKKLWHGIYMYPSKKNETNENFNS